MEPGKLRRETGKRNGEAKETAILTLVVLFCCFVLLFHFAFHFWCPSFSVAVVAVVAVVVLLGQVGVQFGYFRLHEVDRDLLRPVETSFWRCFKPLACLGSKNPKMEGRYFSELVNESRTYTVNGSWSVQEIDLAATDIEPERCNKGTTKVLVLGGDLYHS